MYRPLKVPLSISLFCYPFFIFSSSWKINFLSSNSYSSIIICKTIGQTIFPNGTYLSKWWVRKFGVMLIEWLPAPQECSLSPPLRQINTAPMYVVVVHSTVCMTITTPPSYWHQPWYDVYIAGVGALGNQRNDHGRRIIFVKISLIE